MCTLGMDVLPWNVPGDVHARDGSGWMYTLGMDVHGRDGAQSGARLAVGGCILFRSSFFFLHNNNTLQHLIMAISINTTHGSVTN